MARGTSGGVRIDLERLSFAYGRDGAGAGLRDLTLSAPAGEVTAVLGPSGAGKSTLLSLVAGLLPPDRGDVRFDGRSVVHLPPEKRHLGVVFQSYALFAHMTVEDNVAFGLTVRGVGRRAARRRVADLLGRFEIARLARRFPVQLSGGERQRVALARALAAAPRALLLDEPLAALDARLRLALRAELAERLAESGITALYVTHDQEEAMALGDRVAVLRDGRLEQVGTPEALYRRPASPFVASFIGEANFLPVAWDAALGVLSGPLGTWSVKGTVQGSLEASAAAALTAAPGDQAVNEAAGGAARLMVRPEDLAPAPPERAHLAGTVIASTFLGGRRRLIVRVRPLDADADPRGGAGSPVDLQVDLPGAEAARPGDELALAIDLERAVLLPDGDADPGAARGVAPDGAGEPSRATGARAPTPPRAADEDREHDRENRRDHRTLDDRAIAVPSGSQKGRTSA